MTENIWSGTGLSELPAGFWPRMLALWVLAPVPFFAAFDGKRSLQRWREMWLACVEDHLRAAEEG